MAHLANIDLINLLFEELLENQILNYKKTSSSLNDYLSKIMAKSKSLSKKTKSSKLEQEELINQLFACAESRHCPEKKKIFHTIDLDYLKKIFK